MEDYDITPVARAIADFVGENLSNWYVRLNRKRFWGGGMNEDKLVAYSTLHICLKTVAQLMASFAPFFAERLWRDLGGNDSVHLTAFPIADSSMIDRELEEQMDIAQRISSMVLALRRKVNIKVRQPLQKMMIPILDEAMACHISAIDGLIRNEVNVKELELLTETAGVITKRIKPNFKTLGPRYGKQMKGIAAIVADFSQEDIAKIEAENGIRFVVEDVEIVTTLEDFEIVSEDMPGWLVTSENGLTVALDITVTDKLRREGIARELINRIQNIRKDSGFEVTDHISIEIEKLELVEDAVTEYAEYICQQTLAESIVLSTNPQGKFRVNSDIDDLPIVIAVTKI
jgi:isoleucyl-tRNA synthetase